MIERDQPTCFPNDIVVRVSSVEDGTVLDRAVGIHDPSIVTNRTKFCDACNIIYGDVVFQRIVYGEEQTYDRVVRVGETDTCKYTDEVMADALITDSAEVGMLLPVADCVATVLYDPGTKQLALAHLGRHSTMAGLMEKVIAEMVAGGADPAAITTWMAPSVQAESYRMDYFDLADSEEWRAFAAEKPDGIYLDLQGFNTARALEAGVPQANIHRSPVDTAKSEQYFSHSQGDALGRFAVLAYRSS